MAGAWKRDNLEGKATLRAILAEAPSATESTKQVERAPSSMAAARVWPQRRPECSRPALGQIRLARREARLAAGHCTPSRPHG